MKARRDQLIIDPQKCTGCSRCMIACAMEHSNKPDPKLSRVQIQVFKEQEINVPIICMACEQAPCIKVCPMNARIRQKNGTVTTNTEVCIGCRACVYICPVGSPAVDPSTGQTMTCDMCADESGEPWCVTACRPEGALTLCTSGSAAKVTARNRAHVVRAIYPSK